MGAAVGTNMEDIDRAKLLVDSGCDLIVVDTAHGHSKKVLDTLSKIKKKHKINSFMCWEHCYRRGCKKTL